MVLINKTNRDGSIKTDYESFWKFLEEVRKENSWIYFSLKELFNPFKDFGYKDYNIPAKFIREYEQAVEEWKKLVPGMFN